MRPHERPPRIWPVLLASLLAFGILVGLGVWQLQRLQWKEALLAQLAANASAHPMDIAAAEQLIASGGNVEFVKLKFHATYLNGAWKKMISTFEGGQGWTIIAPAVTPDGRAVMIDRGNLPGQMLDSFDKPEGDVEITGVVRTYGHGQGYFDPDNEPAANLWFWWDVPAMLKTSNLPPDLKPVHFVVQVLPGTVTAKFPRPVEPKANLSNNHLGYAITWFGLAATLAAVSFFYIRGLKNAPRP